MEEPTLNVRLSAKPEPPVELEPAAPVEDDPESATFTATFVSGAPQLGSLTVKCHRGAGSGPGTVTVLDAEAGPCRVQAQGPDGSVVTFFTLDGPGTYTCFAEGSRNCQ